MLGIPAVLELTVTLLRVGMGLPPHLLVTGMSLAPLAPAVADHLSVFGIGHRFPAMVFRTTAALTIGLAASALVRAILRRFEQLMAVAAATARQTDSSGSAGRPIPLRKSDEEELMGNGGALWL